MIDQMVLTNIYKTFYLKAAEYILFSSTHGLFPRIEHILDHKTSLTKLKVIQVISNKFSNIKWIKLEN